MVRRSVWSALVVITLAGILVTAGCGGPAGDWHTVSYAGDLEQADSGEFIMQGTISIGRGEQPDAAYHDVQVVLYDDQKQVIGSYPVGALATRPADGPQSQSVNITSDENPTYVLIESPEFWKNGTNMEIEAFVHEEVEEVGGPDARYESHLRAAPDELFPEDD